MVPGPLEDVESPGGIVLLYSGYPLRTIRGLSRIADTRFVSVPVLTVLDT